MISIALPAELELPEGQSELSATIEVVDGQPYLVALDGIPVGEEEEEEGPEMEEGENMDEADFLAAVERGMAQ